MSPQSADLAAIVSNKLKTLSAKTFAELAALPSMASEDIMVDGKKLTLTIWHDVLPSQEHRIAVQLSKSGMLGLGVRVLADGFVVNAQNEKRTLSTAEWAPFG